MSPKVDVHGSEAEPVIEMMSLTAAVPVEQMPLFLQERIKRTPPSITVEDVRALARDERAKTLAVVERAARHHRTAAEKYRNRGNAADLMADNLEAFLGAARR
jgi:hypothetical protein